MDKLTGVFPAQPDPAPHADYPKWLVPHPSHVDGSGRALAFREFKGRDGITKVLVMSRNEEEIALSPKAGGGIPDESQSGDASIAKEATREMKDG